jgi:prepilin-type N-terminal cleavage/methylation domain-containing protein
MKKQPGFTLIEVLTVIMIIAILASIVLVSLETARNRTKDVTIQNQLGQLRSLAEASYSLEDGYEDISDSLHPDYSKYNLVSSKITEMEGALVWELSPDNKEYCAYSNLIRNTNDAFCVDSTGNALVLQADPDLACNTLDSGIYSCVEEGGTSGCIEHTDCPEGWFCIDGTCEE